MHTVLADIANVVQTKTECKQHQSNAKLRYILKSIVVYVTVVGDRGGTVVKVLCYKSEGRWFDSRWCHWNFSLT